CVGAPTVPFAGASAVTAGALNSVHSSPVAVCPAPGVGVTLSVTLPVAPPTAGPTMLVGLPVWIGTPFAAGSDPCATKHVATLTELAVKIVDVVPLPGTA